MDTSPAQIRPSVLYFEPDQNTYDINSTTLNRLGLNVIPVNSLLDLKQLELTEDKNSFKGFGDQNVQAVLLRYLATDFYHLSSLDVVRNLKDQGLALPIIIMIRSGLLKEHEKNIPENEKVSAGIQIFNSGADEISACLLYTAMRAFFPKETEKLRRVDFIGAMGFELNENRSVPAIDRERFRTTTQKLVLSVMDSELQQRGHPELLEIINKWRHGKEGDQRKNKER